MLFTDFGLGVKPVALHNSCPSVNCAASEGREHPLPALLPMLCVNEATVRTRRMSLTVGKRAKYPPEKLHAPFTEKS